MYAVYRGASAFPKNEIIVSILEETNNLKSIKKIISNIIIYAGIYISAAFIFPFILSIPHIITLLFRAIVGSASIIGAIIIVNYYNNKKCKTDKKWNDKEYKIKYLSYKASIIIVQIYIILFIFILVISILHLPYIAFYSSYFFILYWKHYLFDVTGSFYIVVLLSEYLLFRAVYNKYNIINHYLNKGSNKLWIEVLLKNGGKINGKLDGITYGFIQLNNKATIYKIKYKQIEVIGCRYSSEDE
jgi:hypothetical protein